MYVFMCVHVVPMCARGGQRSTLMMLSHTLPCFMLHGLTDQELSKQAWLARPGVFLTLPPQCQDHKLLTPCLAFYVGLGDRTWVYQDIQGKMLLTESSSQPLAASY